MVADILQRSASGHNTGRKWHGINQNTEIAEKVGIDYSIFKDMCSESRQ